MKKNSLTKLLALTLCAVLALSLFAGCAAKTEPAQTEPAQTETAPAEEPASAEEEAEQRRLYEEDNEDIPIEGDDDLVF